jgi:hypothetical protein
MKAGDRRTRDVCDTQFSAVKDVCPVSLLRAAIMNSSWLERTFTMANSLATKKPLSRTRKRIANNLREIMVGASQLVAIPLALLASAGQWAGGIESRAAFETIENHASLKGSLWPSY